MGSESIELVKYQDGDFDTYYSLVREDKLMRYISGQGLTIQEALAKFDSIIKINNKELSIGYFKVYNGRQDFIGDGKLEWNKYDGTKLDIGYILKEEFWKKGYGTMLCSKLLSLAESIYPQTDIIGIIDPENIASKSLLEKFGFKTYFTGVEDSLPTQKLVLRRKN
jgi:ribosomal-protein-alanine N-acetyltransferase